MGKPRQQLAWWGRAVLRKSAVEVRLGAPRGVTGNDVERVERRGEFQLGVGAGRVPSANAQDVVPSPLRLTLAIEVRLACKEPAARRRRRT